VTNSRLVWLDRTGRAIGTLPVPSAQYQLPSLSPDDRTLLVGRSQGPNEADELLIDLARGVATRFTYGPRQNIFGCWSSDGSRIAFESNRNGLFDIYVKPANGARPESALIAGGSQFKHPFSWSPDDRLLAFYALDAKTGFDLWLAPTDGSGPPRVFLQTPFQEQFPAISPDGRWMLYNSDESGRSEEYVQSFPEPGNKYQLTTGGCFYGLWRGNGKEIFLVGLDGQSILQADVLESATAFHASTPRLLFRLPANVVGFAATRDGQRFVCPIPEGRSGTQTATIVLDWQSELAARRAER
jgi:Tol biopolymer transport system component